MNKFVVVFGTNNKSWCIYNVELEPAKNTNGGDAGWKLDSNVHNTTTMKHYYHLPTSLLYGRNIENKYVFDSRAEANAAIDSLVQDKIRDALRMKERQIEILQTEMEKLKDLKPKGRFRNFLNPKAFRT